MAEIIKKIKAPATESEIDVILDFGDDLDGAVAKFGKDPVFSGFQRMAVTDAMNKGRAMLNVVGADVDEVKAKIEAWIPGTKLIGGITVDPVAVLAKRIESGDMTQEELLAFQKQIQESIAKRG